MGLITRGVFTYILNVITILVEEDNPFSVDSFHAVSPWYLLLNLSNRFYTSSKIKSVGKYVIYVVGSFINYYFFVFTQGVNFVSLIYSFIDLAIFF